MGIIGIRREDKNIWEKRVPLVPEDVKHLIDTYGLEVHVQPARDHRSFEDQEYIDAGAEIREDLSECNIIFGVKEIPDEWFYPGRTHMFFSHVVKGQEYNMPMLTSLMKKKCSLLDYEKVENSDGRRLIFFGRFAGLAGMVETLHTLGARLDWENISNPFSKIQQPYKYASLEEIKRVVRELGEDIHRNGLPDILKPFVCGFTGYGNVSMGAQEIYDLLGVVDIDPESIRGGLDTLSATDNVLYKAVFYEKHMFKPKDETRSFELQDYFTNPVDYENQFDDFIHNLTMIVNCIFWTDVCPRLVTKKRLHTLFSRDEMPRLRVIGDISCDIEGSIEATIKPTDLDQPAYVFDPIKEIALPGVAGIGPVITAIENLPCEIPKDASREFSNVLTKFVPGIAAADYSTSNPELPPEIARALIVHQGELTDEYKYIIKFLTRNS